MVNNNTHGSITEDTKKGYSDLKDYELGEDELAQVSGAGETEVKEDKNIPLNIIPETQNDKMNEGIKGESGGEGFLMNHMIDVNNYIMGRTVF